MQKLFLATGVVHYEILKQSIWLYVYCLAKCHPITGSLTTNIDKIAGDLQLKKATVQSWSGQLRKANLISIRKYGDIKLIRLTNWPAKNNEHSNKAQTQESVKQKQTCQRSKITKIDAKSEALNNQATPENLANTLNAPDQMKLFEQICQDYPHHLIHKSLQDAQAVPDENIKKSRLALFVFLIKKYANQQEK
ncbi:MAG: hypothetical protein H6696_14985 [Deferribacteres bacterium]|nr:hypothetical protein [Deferribacteres bacterium]